MGATRFELATAGRVIFGAGTLSEVGPIAARMGGRALVVTGRSSDRAKPLLDILSSAAVETVVLAVHGEPTTDDAKEGTRRAVEENCDLIIGFGGGSALDAGKAIAALLANGGEPLDYLEVIGRGRPLSKPSAPFIAVPTTAGTGTEVTRNAVLASPEHRVKVSLRSEYMLARVAVVDPQLTYDLPPDVTARTGLDALTQLIEPYVSLKANPLTDSVCREGMVRAARSLRRAYDNGHDAEARRDMSIASLFGGLALANAGLGAVHGFAGPIGGMFAAPHGAVCAGLLGPVMEANITAIRRRSSQSPVLERYDEIARILTRSPVATAEDGVVWVRELCQALSIPGLSAHGVGEQDLDTLVAKAARASSMKGNPIKLTAGELRTILTRAL